MFDAADLAVFIDPDMPGYVSATISATPVGGLFKEAYAEYGPLSGTAPSLLVPAAIAAPEGTAVVIGARNFVVAHGEPDGAGFQRLRLDAQ